MNRKDLETDMGIASPPRQFQTIRNAQADTAGRIGRLHEWFHRIAFR